MRATDDEFRELVERHQAMVFSIALRITGSPETAEEVAQDTFLNLYSSFQHLKSDDHVTFWLRRVAIHRAIDAVRRRLHHPEYRAEEWQEEQQKISVNVPAGRNGIGVRLDHILRSLPEPLREVVILRYQEDLEPGEIAEVLDQPLATVKSNLQRALDLMRRKAAVVLR